MSGTHLHYLPSNASNYFTFRSLGEHGEVRMAIDGITLDSEGGQEREGGSEGEKERAGSERGADYSFGAKEERLAKGGRVREERLVLKPKHKDDIYVLQISQVSSI